jgi:hypothetical protein
MQVAFRYSYYCEFTNITQWPGYRVYQKQKHARRVNGIQDRKKVVAQVAEVVRDFFNASGHSTPMVQNPFLTNHTLTGLFAIQFFSALVVYRQGLD